MAPYTDRVDDEISPATKLVDSRYRFPLSLSEDIGKPVGRIASNNHASVREAVDVITPSERGRYAEKHPHERDGAALDATSPANGEIELPQSGSGAAIAGITSYVSSASTKRHRQRKPGNAIDDLFQGLS